MIRWLILLCIPLFPLCLQILLIIPAIENTEKFMYIGSSSQPVRYPKKLLLTSYMSFEHVL